ncbi:MAG: formylglycine-generating enzyme family protein, partial [Myxococcota bacterium]
MRPLLLAATLAVPFLHGCAKTCTTEGLQASLSAPDPTASAKALATACASDESLAGWLNNPDAPPTQAAWREACRGDVDVASLTSAPLWHNRKMAFEQCNVTDLGLPDQQAFVLASANPARAMAVTAALVSNERVDDSTATRVGTKLLGAPMMTLPAVTLPGVEGAPGVATAVPTVILTAQGITQNGKDATLRSLARQPDAVLAVSADVPANTLLRAIAAVTPPGDTTPVWVMSTVDGLDDRPTLLPLGHAADGTEAGNWLAHTPGQTSADYLSQAAKQGSTPTIDTRLGLCEDAPTGMVCVPGGAVSDTVSVSTFYADAMEASVDDYKACVAAGACTAIPTRAAPEQPIQGLSFIDARMYCSYAGKRLPTQWEFKRLAQGTPADQAGTCEINQHNKCDGGVRNASAGSPNQWGAFNVLGNVAEATSTYPPKGNERCGDRCEGLDPLGFCDGAPMCKGRLSRIFEGGSASTPPPAKGWPAAAVTHKKRRLASQGVRCVSDDVVLESLPSEWVQSPPPAPTMPAPLDEAGRAIMTAIAEDNIDEIPECDDGRRGSSRTDCKDPTHYIYPNEDRAPIT